MSVQDIVLIQLAREIAIDHLESDQLQELYKLTPEEWLIIQQNPRFQRLLEAEIVAWQSATNTTERTKLKAGAMIEHWLPEANTRMHDPNETLNSKVELAKLMSRIAGMEKPEGPALTGSGFSVTINLGKTSLEFDKTPKTIEHRDPP